MGYAVCEHGCVAGGRDAASVIRAGRALYAPDTRYAYRTLPDTRYVFRTLVIRTGRSLYVPDTTGHSLYVPDTRYTYRTRVIRTEHYRTVVIRTGHALYVSDTTGHLLYVPDIRYTYRTRDLLDGDLLALFGPVLSETLIIIISITVFLLHSPHRTQRRVNSIISTIITSV